MLLETVAWEGAWKEGAHRVGVRRGLGRGMEGPVWTNHADATDRGQSGARGGRGYER
jgi:hypothetical protein